jgi:hypothetical protein
MPQVQLLLPTVLIASLEGTSTSHLTLSERKVIAMQEQLEVLKRNEAAERERNPLLMDVAQRTGMELPRVVHEQELKTAKAKMALDQLHQRNPLLADAARKREAFDKFIKMSASS